MRSNLLLMVGLIAGAAIGAYASSHFGQTEMAPAIPTQPKAIAPKPSKVASSPFAPIKEQTTFDEIKTSTPIARPVNSQAEFEHLALPEKHISEIKHYREITQYLQYIDGANSEELNTLLLQIKSRDDRSPFARTLHAAIYQRWAEIDIDAALSHSIAAIKNQHQQYSRWAHEGLTLLARIDPDLAREYVEGAGSTRDNPQLTHALYAGMASHNPEQMVRELIANTGSRHTRDNEALYVAMNEWANTDPQAAWNLIQSEADTETKSMLSSQILYQWYEKDPDAAITEIETLLSSNSVDRQQQSILNDLYITHLAKTDPDAAYQWALSQDDTNAREGALMTLISNWDENDSVGLESFIDQLNPADRDRIMPMAMFSISSNMARTDPAGAMAWADQLPEQQRLDVQMNIANMWSMNDPEAAADWLFNLPESQTNTQLMMSVAGTFIHSNPAVSKRVYAKMPATMQSEYAEQMIFSISGLESPEAARQWLSEQTNSDIQETGALIIDSMDPNSDTTTLLERVANHQGNHRENLLFSAIGQRMGSNREEVLQWMANTTQLTADERSMLSEMTREVSRFNGAYGIPSRQFGESSDRY